MTADLDGELAQLVDRARTGRPHLCTCRPRWFVRTSDLGQPQAPSPSRIACGERVEVLRLVEVMIEVCRALVDRLDDS